MGRKQSSGKFVALLLFVDCTADQGAAFLNLAIVYAALVSQLEWNCGVTFLFGLDLVETRGFLK